MQKEFKWLIIQYWLGGILVWFYDFHKSRNKLGLLLLYIAIAFSDVISLFSIDYILFGFRCIICHNLQKNSLNYHCIVYLISGGRSLGRWSLQRHSQHSFTHNQTRWQIKLKSESVYFRYLITNDCRSSCEVVSWRGGPVRDELMPVTAWPGPTPVLAGTQSSKSQQWYRQSEGSPSEPRLWLNEPIRRLAVTLQYDQLTREKLLLDC